MVCANVDCGAGDVRIGSLWRDRRASNRRSKFLSSSWLKIVRNMFGTVLKILRRCGENVGTPKAESSVLKKILPMSTAPAKSSLLPSEPRCPKARFINWNSLAFCTTVYTLFNRTSHGLNNRNRPRHRRSRFLRKDPSTTLYFIRESHLTKSSSQGRAGLVALRRYRGGVNALGRAYYKGGFEPRMNRREAALILELPCGFPSTRPSFTNMLTMLGIVGNAAFQAN